MPYNDFKHCISNIFFPFGKMIGTVRSRTSFILSSRFWVIRCPPTGGAGRMQLSARIDHTHLTHSYILKKDPPPHCKHCQCNQTVRHILMECNHLAQTRDIFGRRDVVEYLDSTPHLFLAFFKESQFYYKLQFR